MLRLSIFALGLLAVTGCAGRQRPDVAPFENAVREPQSIASYCVDFVRAWFGANALSESAQATLGKLTREFRFAPHGWLKNAEIAEVMHVFHRLPEGARDIYLDAPRSKGGVFRHLEAMSDALEEGVGLLPDFHQHMKNQAFWMRDSKEHFVDWLRESYAAFLRLAPADKDAAAKKFLKAQFIAEVNRHFDRSYYAPISIVDRDGVKGVQIGDEFYTEFREGRGSISIKVPRSRVTVGADNAFETAKIRAIVERGGSVKGTYDVNVSLHGVFVIVDGNHRFDLLDRRPYVWVRFGAPRTMSIREHLIRAGLSEPTLELRARVMRGEISPLELLPPDSRGIPFRVDQLHREPVLPLLDL